MPKIPSTQQVSEFRLRRALSAMLRKLGLLKEEGVADEATLLALAAEYAQKPSTRASGKLSSIQVGKSKPKLPMPPRANQDDFDLEAWQATLVIPPGYCEADIPF